MSTQQTALAGAASAARKRRVDWIKVGVAPVFAIVLAVLAWYVVGFQLERFPLPHHVLLASIAILTTADAYVDIAATLRRVLVGFAGGSVLGMALGMAMGSVPWCRQFFKPWVVVALATPGPVAIIAAILVLGIGESSALIALIFSVTPYVVNIIVDAVGGLDVRLNEMSDVFRASVPERWRHVLFPQLVPATLAALQTAFALSWKLVVVIEALSVSRGIGAQMLRSFRLLDIAEGIAWASVFALAMWLVDANVFQRAESHLLRWRTQAEWR